jgi:hypothetical protein
MVQKVDLVLKYMRYYKLDYLPTGCKQFFYVFAAVATCYGVLL